MRRARDPKGFAGLVFALGAALAAFASPASAGPSCTGSQHLIDQSFANGARWQLCWEQVPDEAIIYSEIHFTPPGGSETLILTEAHLAQIHVPYDDNGARFHDVTDYGAGGSNLNNLAAADCPGGTRLVDGVKNAVCKTLKTRGAAYDARGDQQQGSMLELFSVSHIGAYNYIPTYRFMDDGAIEIVMGATGALQRFVYSDPSKAIYGWPLDPNSNRIGISHIHNYYFRLDFDLGGTASDDIFERIDITPDASAGKRTRSFTAFAQEGPDLVAPDTMRSWRVRDAVLTNSHGHPISYELVPLETGHRDIGPAYEPFTHNDIYVTKYASNERYASHNDNLMGGGAPENLTEFYAPAASIAGGSDLVVWYGLTFHHIPRDEDESKMHAHWNGFRLEPRDWFDAQPLVTDFPPDLQNPGDQLSWDGATVSLQLSASDPESGLLGYVAFGLPPGLSINTSTGEIYGTLSAATGSHAVEVRADDGNSFDSESFIWTVETDDPPVWIDPGDLLNTETDGVSRQLSATNPDGPPPNYSAVGLPPGLTIDSASGLVSGWLDYASAGVYEVVATADDGANFVDQPFTWTVQNLNRPPVWTDPGAQVNDEGEIVSVFLVATDPDAESLSFDASGLPPGLELRSNTGEIYGWLSYTDSGIYSVVATATDGTDPVDMPFDWTVNEEPAPEIPALPPAALLLTALATAASAALLLRASPRR